MDRKRRYNLKMTSDLEFKARMARERGVEKTLGRVKFRLRVNLIHPERCPLSTIFNLPEGDKS